jgi:hypothetical protein
MILEIIRKKEEEEEIAIRGTQKRGVKGKKFSHNNE